MPPDPYPHMIRFQPTWRTRLATWLPSWRARGLFAQVKQFVLFVGYPRTGHSLLGSLLNAHPQALIGHELNVMHYVKRGFNRRQLYYLLWRQDQAFAEIERTWTDYDYRVPGQWQGRWDTLTTIGDKHGNGASKLLGLRPDLLGRLEQTVGVPVKLIHVVRHPLDTISTMARRSTSGMTLPACVAEYERLCRTNRALSERCGERLHTLYLEEFIAQPEAEFRRLLRFLDLPAAPDYVSACCGIVARKPSVTRQLVEWSPELLAPLEALRQECPFLHRYGEPFTSAAQPARRAA